MFKSTFHVKAPLKHPYNSETGTENSLANSRGQEQTGKKLQEQTTFFVFGLKMLKIAHPTIEYIK